MAVSGCWLASTAWTYRWLANGWLMFSFITASSVATISSVPGLGAPSLVHWFHGERSIIDSANHAPTSASSGCLCQTFRIASA